MMMAWQRPQQCEGRDNKDDIGSNINPTQNNNQQMTEAIK